MVRGEDFCMSQTYCIFTWQEKLVSSVGFLLLEHETHSRGLHPQDLITSPKPHLLTPSLWGLCFNLWTLGGHNSSQNNCLLVAHFSQKWSLFLCWLSPLHVTLRNNRTSTFFSQLGTVTLHDKDVLLNDPTCKFCRWAVILVLRKSLCSLPPAPKANREQASFCSDWLSFKFTKNQFWFFLWWCSWFTILC